MIPPGEGTISANYGIDGREPVTRTVPGLSQDIPVYFQMLYTSPILRNTNHNLTVQMVETGGGRNYSFQQFKVSTPRDDGQQTHSKKGNSDDDKGHDSGGLLVAAIILGSVLLVLLLMLALLAAFCLWRKRSAQAFELNLYRSPDTTKRLAVGRRGKYSYLLEFNLKNHCN